MKHLIEIWDYREMIFSLVRRDLRGRYKGSILGFFWTFLNPLLQLVVYTIVFSNIMRAGIEDYYLFLFVALVPWLFFSACVSSGCSCIIAQQDMVKKIYFPREILPLSFVISQFVNMILSFIIVFLVLGVTKHAFNLEALLLLPVIMLVEFIFALGVTFIVCSLTVYVRDLQYLLGIVIMAWQFLTPIMYSIEAVPKEFKFIFFLNPMTSIITAYRDVLYYAKIPAMNTLISVVLVGILFVMVGWIIFGKLQRRFAEEM